MWFGGYELQVTAEAAVKFPARQVEAARGVHGGRAGRISLPASAVTPLYAYTRLGRATSAIWSRLVEMRTIAGPASVVQWVLSGGPYNRLVADSARPRDVAAAVASAVRAEGMTVARTATRTPTDAGAATPLEHRTPPYAPCAARQKQTAFGVEPLGLSDQCRVANRALSAV